MRRPEVVYLCLGGNEGDVVESFSLAISAIRERIGQIISMSGVYESEAWGYVSANRYKNQVVEIGTLLSPMEVLKECLAIEKSLGRQRLEGKIGYSDRPIDIDILQYGDLVIKLGGLELPHPRMVKRMFVMRPLMEVASWMIIAGDNRRVSEVYGELKLTVHPSSH